MVSERPISKIFQERLAVVFAVSYCVALLLFHNFRETDWVVTALRALFLMGFFFLLFGLVSHVFNRTVLRGLGHIRTSLAKINDGDLFEEVCVRDNQEYSAISDSVNSTVTALKQAVDEAVSRIDAELELARSIQLSSLPNIFPPYPDRQDFDIYAQMITAKEVGGDFYDFYLVDSNHLAVLIADVAGKEIGAALFMMTAKTTIKHFVESGMPPEDAFTAANNELCNNNEVGMFVTAFLGILALDTGEFTYANAGHNPPYLYRAGEGYAPLAVKADFILAGMEGIRYHRHSVTLQPGDRLFLYTDGITEAMNSRREFFGDKRFADFLNRSRQPVSVQDLAQELKKELDQFSRGAVQADDITMLALEYRGASNAAKVRDLELQAVRENLPRALDFVASMLKTFECPLRARNQIAIAVEEIFMNIASYAYDPEVGPAAISCEVINNPLTVIVKFSDRGAPYNPLEREEPDTSLPPDERDFGGLGILMAKKCMDSIEYEYRDGKNILTLKKNI